MSWRSIFKNNQLQKIAMTFADDTDLEPSRQWTNTVVDKLDINLDTPQTIEYKRWGFIHCIKM